MSHGREARVLKWLAASAAEEEWRSLSEHSFNKRSIMAAKNCFSALGNWLSWRIGQSIIPEGEDSLCTKKTD